MPHIAVADAKAWAESIKLPVNSLLSNLEDAQSTIVLSRLSSAFDTSTWVDVANTPKLVKTIIAMRYIAYLIDETYAEDEDLNAYADLLLKESEALILGVVTGTIEIIGLPDGVDRDLSGPLFYPTDASSALEPTTFDRSLGPAKFSMGQIF